MATPSRRRLLKDLEKLRREPAHGVTAAPLEDNIMKWQALIIGPDDSPWEGGTFNLRMHFSEEYPNKAPEIVFVSSLFHPNVYKDGRICLDILQSKWSPVNTVQAVLVSIQSLLSDPNTGSPANAEAARLYDADRAEYNRRVQRCVEASWAAHGVSIDAIAADDTAMLDDDTDSDDEDDEADNLDGGGGPAAAGAASSAGAAASAASS
ncbi:hypothetical protein FNF27_00248 [Cafeteria roenbergensis]|uniref:UBC core domain-containing protein n=2 Tax=Cafeteria roenbergensis TaxID=33653 RepID=A0A5A8CS66_CAFRO|nr:hypothetical protein FNF29_01382 [Cafeteria roenbergensis]KAA0163642.1 hypothetical protein FNF31_02803 [Cafeteria roenbergensis]KAA0171828.1 hypothetical protein FNF28_00464 [Cafeteria roenbergensis]KAA0178399.1 hypothetical protein FNF27_00248 [Cafeteria roenbergensis]|eukprot:KAA0155963.1 hypothetical protein FNF29_01382 [Cafeteria roenbergensis]